MGSARHSRRSWLMPYAPRTVEARLDEVVRRHPLRLSLLILLGCVAAPLLGLALLPVNPGGCIVGLELAGSVDRFTALLAECELSVGEVQRALIWDYLFIAIYSLALYTGCAVSAFTMWSGMLRDLALAGAVAAVAAAVADVVENGLLLVAISARPEVSDALPAAAESFALAKFVAVAVPVAVIGSALVGVSLRWFNNPAEPLSVTVPDTSTSPGAGAEAAWTQNMNLPSGQRQLADGSNGESEAGRNVDGGVGVCLSGGGIRSGTFSMGALHELSAAGTLSDARFLSTVSGGGYVGGALQMLRHRAAEDDRPIPIGDAFGPGSPETDHVRRHGKFVAENPMEWVAAIATVLRNVIFGLGLSYATLATAAGGLTLWYLLVEEWSRGIFLEEGTLTPAAVVATAIPVVAGVVVWLTTALGEVGSRHLRYRAAVVVTSLGGLTALVTIVLPVLVNVVVDFGERALGDRSFVGAGSLTAIVATATFVWNAIGRRGAKVTGDELTKWRKLLSRAAFATRFITTVLVVLLIVGVALVVFVSVLTQSVGPTLEGSWSGLMGPAVGAIVLIVAFILLDQTRMSLHPFYKKRLATAFAIERTAVGARQIPYEEVTRISEYGQPLDADGTRNGEPRLQLVVSAAGHVSGASDGTPGRRVVPFTFASDGIGSPRLGYLDPKEVEQRAAHTSYSVDITQTAAAALSGAAFASSMGRHSGPFDAILALTNARLGAWLPNPRYHHRRAQGRLPLLEEDRKPLPATRRIQYFLKEIFGVYRPRDRFIYITDGGHYENLGLVELLRRRCTTIYCIDASGDSATPRTIAQAVSLAYEELGVVVDLDGVDRLHTGLAEHDDPLAERMSEANVITGTITYPDLGGDLPALTGTLVVGKSRLTPALRDTPLAYPALSHAAANAEFPNDSTADQWFDGDQFQAYYTLGQCVGRTMVAHRVGAQSGQQGTGGPGAPVGAT